MKKLLILPSIFLLILGMTNTADALTFTHKHDARHLYMQGSLFGEKDTTSWTFNLLVDEFGNEMFNPDTQNITSASIELSLTDENDGCFWWEFAGLNVGQNRFVWEVDTGETSFEVTSLMTLNNTGMMVASLTALWGDFFFDSATLTAEAFPSDLSGASPVPEPAAMLLFGTGLVGLTFATRRRLFRVE